MTLLLKLKIRKNESIDKIKKNTKNIKTRSKKRNNEIVGKLIKLLWS